MNLAAKKEIQDLLEKYEIRPTKKFGQNFLVDEKILEQIVDAAEISKEDTVLEIGPGLGALTLELTKKAKKIIAVEKDEKMCEILKKTLKDCKDVDIINADILIFLASQEEKEEREKNVPSSKLQVPCSMFHVPSSKFQVSGYKIVANLPYYVATPIIRMFLEAKNPPKEMVLTIQKEVGERIVAKPPKSNLLAIACQFYADIKILFYIPADCFWPKPKVDGAVIKIIPKLKSEIKTDPLQFFKIVKAGFSQPRKQLAKNLAEKLKISRPKIEIWLAKNNINPKIRAEALSLLRWINLAETAKF